MKKLIVLLLVALLVTGMFTACRAEDPSAPTPEVTPAPATPMPTPTPEPEPTPHPNAADIRIAWIEPSPASISHNGDYRGGWLGIQRFLDSHGLSADNVERFQPHADSDEARIDLITDAIDWWDANIIVMQSNHFTNASAVVQDMFPDVKFILLDATPADGPAENLVAIHFAEEQAGFLAGYAAVMDGHRSLGFMGGIAVPSVVRYGYGFLYGADYAAAALNLAEGEVTVRYTYLGNFAPSPEHVMMAAAWFEDGVEVIFAAAGGGNFSVISAAHNAGALVIGTDDDQAGAGGVVLTSAMKMLNVAVYDMLTDILYDEFIGGRILRFDASNDGVGLPMDTSRFQTFTQAQYDAIFGLLADGTVVVDDTHHEIVLHLVVVYEV
ncbi:MAG: BMP family ABC transporter substrate-binding protein [Oscillospiraceae bacterium]|nr:BMP family ABC transporter substrate-binding protein [Oscillospiraceae bacterium]